MTLSKDTRLNDDQLSDAHHEYNKDLNSYAFYKLRNKAVGEDLVQDTFSKTWLYLVKGGKIVLMKAFLYHVLNNLIVDEYRKQKNRTESLDTLLEKGFEPKDDNSESFIDVLDGKVAMNKMVDLPKLYKKVMYMRFSNSMTLDDISHATGQTKNAISVKIYRGLQKLKILCSKRLSILKK